MKQAHWTDINSWSDEAIDNLMTEVFDTSDSRIATSEESMAILAQINHEVDYSEFDDVPTTPNGATHLWLRTRR